MINSQAAGILTSMINFIKAHGQERVQEINRQAQADFTVGMEKTIEAEKKRLLEKQEKDLNIAEINLKIERSAEQNRQRIEKMQSINELVESLQVQAKHQLAKQIEDHPDEYALLLKNLLVQGMIKLIEASIVVRVRESDVDVIEGVLEDAIAEYKQLMLTQVKALEGKDDIPAKLTIDKNNFLPEWNPEDPDHSCLGGFVLLAKKNRIVCSQTLDDRIAMVYQQAIPQIRVSLFPSLRKPERKI